MEEDRGGGPRRRTEEEDRGEDRGGGPRRAQNQISGKLGVGISYSGGGVPNYSDARITQKHVSCSTLLYSILFYSTLPYYTILYHTVLYSRVCTAITITEWRLSVRAHVVQPGYSGAARREHRCLLALRAAHLPMTRPQNETGLLLSNFNQATIIQKPCYLLYIPIMVIQVKSLTTTQESGRQGESL